MVEGAAMRTVAECKRFADDCRTAAAKMGDPRDKQRLQEMAAAWEMLAVERERQMSKERE